MNEQRVASGARWLRAGTVVVLAVLAGAALYTVAIGLINFARIGV